MKFWRTLRKLFCMKKTWSVLCGVFLIIFFSNWGFLMHRTVNQLAIYQLPKSMQYFFYSNKEYIVKESVRPDERRNTDSAEAPKHFIDFEAYGDSAAWRMPEDWAEAQRIFTKDTLEKYGYLPFVLADVQQKLTGAFRAGNKDSILFYAADLGHYIGDAHVPLHTSIYYDGQGPDQKGLHSLWESTIPEIELTTYDLRGKQKAKYISSIQSKIWSTLRNSFRLTKDVFELERLVSKDFTPATKYRTQMRRGKESRSYSTEFAKAYAKRLAPTINNQAISSANTLADFWYTAWVDAGRPDLSNLMVTPVSKNDKKAVKKEVEDYKKNRLLKKGLLIARRPQKAEPAD